MKNISIISLVFFVAISTMAAGSALAGDKNILIATGATGGTYYPVGAAVGTLINIKLSRFRELTATAINSAGSGENLQMLKNKDCDMAILLALVGLNAHSGIGAYKDKPVTDFSAVTMLWDDVEHFVVLKDHVKNGTIMDLHNFKSKFSIGSRGSGAETSGRIILTTLGIDPEKEMILEFLGYAPAALALTEGRISGANIPAGPPVAIVTRLYTRFGSKGVRVLDFSDAELATIQEKYPIWNRYVIKAGTYPGQETDINTISQPNFLACRPDLPEETVYLITKTIFENLPFLNNIHKATRAISLDKATTGLPVPLHPGAERFYKEKGLIQ